MKVVIFGSVPPPVGGVTIHLKRFFDKYKNSSEVDLTLLDIKKKKYYFANESVEMKSAIMPALTTNIVHIHLSSNIKIFIAFFYKLLGKKVVYTHHNIRIKNMFLFKVFMLFVDQLILVNDKDISESVKKYNYVVVPAFLPSLESIPLPKELLHDLTKYDNIISTNCFQMTYINGKDLYGFDLCVEAFSKLINDNKIKNTVLLLVDPSATTKKYVETLMEAVTFKNNCNILYVDYMIDFNELIKLSKIVLRATRSDGDSLTIREALYLKTPIIASDITYRADGTITFSHESSDDLADKIFEVLDEKNIVDEYDDIDYGEKIIDIYKSFEIER